MRRELDEQLCRKYPEIFAQRGLPMNQTAMCWGFECGDGWYKLIDDLCAKIMLVSKLANVEPPQATQIKEKYGTLCFYLGPVPNEPEGLADIIFDLVHYTERRSGHTCEVCGEWGKLNQGSWFRCRCQKHWKEDYPFDKEWKEDELP